MTSVRLDAVRKVYPNGHLAVSDLNLRIENGEILVLLGPSGCGKSTVLRMIAGLEEITSGELWLGDRFANELAPRDRNVAMVFQNSALYPHFSVRGNLTFPLTLAGVDKTRSHAMVRELAEALGIGSTLDRAPRTLSGGQKQRVAIGRAIIREPDLFLMDEPLSNLDAGLRTEMRLEIGALARNLGVTTVYVTHDQIEALTLADRIAILRQGVLEDVGTPAQVYGDPATAFVASFLGSPQINLLLAVVWAVPDRGIQLSSGHQSLLIPWTDPRAKALAAHHRSQVIVGIRSDAVTLASAPVPGRTLSGILRTLEFHGHEWLAQLEAGVSVFDIERTAPPKPANAVAGHHEETITARALGLLKRRRPDDQPQHEETHVGTHRRSDLLLRVTSASGLSRHSEVHFDVDLSQIHFFDQNGYRVDPVIR